MAIDIKAIGLSHDMNDHVFVQLARHDLCNGDLRGIDAGHHMRDESGLARPHLARDDDKSLTLREAVAEVGQRLAMRHAAEIEIRIGRKLEWLAGKTVEIVEHGSVLPVTRQKV